MNDTNAPGFGAFCLSNWTRTDSTGYAANPDYFGGKPDIDTVTVKRVPQSSIRVVVLQTGEAPIATALTPRC